MESLISASWLDAELDAPDLVVLECTNFAKKTTGGRGYKTTSGRASWEEGHIAGSGFADFTMGLASENTLYRNSLPSPQQFAAAMGALGVGDDTRVVLYDRGKSMWAARVWWMLRWIGFDNAAVLDGGWQCWLTEGRQVSTKPPEHGPKKLSVRTRPTLFVNKDDLKAALDNGSTKIIDALSVAQFNGTESDLGLSGHIPGAQNIPATSLIDLETGCYLPKSQLSGQFQGDLSNPTIIYCGSGIAAASNAFVMTRLGFTNVSIYMPGLQEWMQDLDAPLVNRQR